MLLKHLKIINLKQTPNAEKIKKINKGTKYIYAKVKNA